MMPVLFSFGDWVSLSEQPELAGASQRLWARTVVLVCDYCARVQDGLAEDASEAKWTDQTTYMTARGVSYGDVWWCHTTCQTCDLFICRRAGCGHGG